MKILITGAAGFLGRAFARRYLSTRGMHDVIMEVDDFSAVGSHWVPPDGDRLGGFTIRKDFGEFLESPDADGHFDVVYHFAAPVGGRLKIEGDPLFNADSLRLDSLMFRWAVEHADLVVYPSSSAVYGASLQANDGLPVALEEMLFDPSSRAWLAPDEMYGFTKLTGEVLAWKAAGYGLNTLCLRPFSGYGEEQSMDYPIPSILARAKRREDPLMVWGSGQQKRDFIHVDDLVGATLARIEAGVLGYQSMNIGSGVGTSFNGIANLAAEIVGYEPMIVNDTDKPEGVFNRVADTHLMSKYYAPKIGLRDGLERVLVSL